MDPHFVSFITVEDGTDLIVSFAVIDPNDGSFLDSLNVIRTPKYEPFLEPQERCAKVSFPLEDNEQDRQPLQAISYSADQGLISIQCEGVTYTLDLSKVEQDELDAMTKIFRKMCRNSDASLTGL